MKKILLSLSTAILITSCGAPKAHLTNTNLNKVSIDLINVKNDKVEVTVKTPNITTNEVKYLIPKIIPGTYSEDDYGKFIDNFAAYDIEGNKLKFAKFDDNSWTIYNAKKLNKISYWVNDTYDIEEEHEIFSPAGTNISNDNFMLNLHGFVGYFDEYKDFPYEISIQKPQELFGATSLTDFDATNSIDLFKLNRYHDVADNPIMYTIPDTTKFNVDGMEILISVYSPNKKHNAKDLKPAMQKMMQAQKKFLGDFNTTEKYSILLYLSTMQNDASGFGALEHMTSTTVVMPEDMEKEILEEQLKDVVSHEFFHIVTPLSIHSEEIQNFDYNNPKMSQHLWLYEGVTEYFANLFQINQDLITEEEFYNRIDEKIKQSLHYNDRLPFTKLSKNVLTGEYKENYINVYQKGALIAMCIDIELREASNGKSGILDLMKKLSKEYGTTKAFKDDELFDKIVTLSNPNIKMFIEKHIQGPEPIDYEKYFNKMGLGIADKQEDGHPFIDIERQLPLIALNNETGEIYIPEQIDLNVFYTNLNLLKNDVIKAVNNKIYNAQNIYDLVMDAQSWKNNDAITLTIIRNTKTITINGKVKLPVIQTKGYIVKDKNKNDLKNNWLKG